MIYFVKFSKKIDAHLWSARRPEVVADLRGGNGVKIERFFECQKPVWLRSGATSQKKVTRTFGVRVDPKVVADLRGGNGTKIEWFFECQKPVIL